MFTGSLGFVRSLNPLIGNAGTRDAATDSNGNFYTIDYRGNRVIKYSPNGSVVNQFGGGPSAPVCERITAPYGIDIDDEDHIYVASSTVGTVKEFQANGTCLGSIGTRGAAANQLLQLRRVAVGRGDEPADLRGRPVGTRRS